MGLLPKKKQATLTQEEIIQERREKTAQNWIPIADIESTIVYRKDNKLVAALRIQPENINLLSDNEKRRRVEALSEELNGEKESIQIFCVGRPVDLNSYLENLQEMAKNQTDFTRKTLLKGYIQQASQMASGGEAIERRFYMIIFKNIDNSKAEEEIMSRLRELRNKLTQAELTSEICKDDELMDVYSLFANPIQAAFEKTEIKMDLPTLLES